MAPGVESWRMPGCLVFPCLFRPGPQPKMVLLTFQKSLSPQLLSHMVIISGIVLSDISRGVLYSSPNPVKLTVKIKLHNYTHTWIVCTVEFPEADGARRREQQRRALMLYFFFFCLALLGIKHRSYCMLGMW